MSDKESGDKTEPASIEVTVEEKEKHVEGDKEQGTSQNVSDKDVKKETNDDSDDDMDKSKTLEDINIDEEEERRMIMSGPRPQMKPPGPPPPTAPPASEAKPWPTKIHLKAPRFSGSWGSEGDRDPSNINDIVKVNFEDVFAEPETSYSFENVWTASYTVFKDSKVCCYRALSSICGVPCALFWGCQFAWLTFCQVWSWTPSIRCIQIQLRPLARIWGMCIKSFCEPCFEAIGKVFSGIRVNIAKGNGDVKKTFSV